MPLLLKIGENWWGPDVARGCGAIHGIAIKDWAPTQGETELAVPWRCFEWQNLSLGLLKMFFIFRMATQANPIRESTGIFCYFLVP